MATSGNDKFLQRRWRKDTLREVFVRDGKTVIKRYWVRPGVRSYPRPWVREHEALQRLEGDGFPRTYGYEQSVSHGGTQVLFSRDFVEGQRLDGVSEEDVCQIAGLLAHIHSRKVVVDDASLRNFVKNCAGRIHLVDFGRARVFSRRTPVFCYYVGKEFLKLFRETLGESCENFGRFRAGYYSASRLPKGARILIRLGLAISILTRALRKNSFAARLLRRATECRLQGKHLVRKRYAGGTFMLRKGVAENVRLEEYISRLEFLSVDEKNRIPTHNKRYLVYSMSISPLAKEYIMKISLVSREYRLLRRLNVFLSQWLRDYARTALLGALALENAGISTIKPVACWRHRESVLGVRSYLLYEKIPAVFSVRDYKLRVLAGDPEGREEVLDVLIEKMADVVASVHRSNLRHDDVASGNFLVSVREGTPGTADARLKYAVSVIDTDHVKRVWWPTAFLRCFFGLKCLRRLDFDEKRRKAFLMRYLGDGYGQFWWKVHEFWRRGGNRPLRTVVRCILRGRE